MLKVSLLALGLGSFTVPLRAQVVSASLPVDSLRNQLAKPSGKLRRGFFWAASPGASYALHFYAPVDGQRVLTGVRVYLQAFGRDTARGKIRVRLASVTDTGAPADDDLAPTQLVLTEPVLQAATKPLLLTWASKSVPVPNKGFFIVLEGLGNTPDEYTTDSPATAHSICADCYTIGQRNAPNAPLRILPASSVPKILAAKPSALPVNYWMRGGHLATWQPFPTSKEVPLVEVLFE